MTNDDWDDDEDYIEPKFDGCETCIHFGDCDVCDDCDAGEYYEEVDPEGVDQIIVER